MNIIKEGKYSTVKEYRCVNCDCEFKLDLGDIMDTSMYTKLDTHRKSHIVCPQCNHWIDVDYKSF